MTAVLAVPYERDAQSRLEAEVAKRVTQCGVLDQQLWAARQDVAKLRRHRGTLTGLLRGALVDDALSDEYRVLVRRVLAELDAER